MLAIPSINGTADSGLHLVGRRRNGAIKPQDFLQTAIVHRVGHLPEGLGLAAGLPLLVAIGFGLAEIHFGHQQFAVAGSELAEVRRADQVAWRWLDEAETK